MFQEAEKTKKFHEWFRERQETEYSRTEDAMFLAFQAGYQAGEQNSKKLINYLTTPRLPSFKNQKDD